MHRGPRPLSLLLALVVSVVGACSSSASPAPSGPVDSPLPAGTHTSTVFQPPVTFTVPEGWALSDDSADYLQLRPAGQDILGIHMFRGVSAASQDPSCPVEAEPGVGTSSVELMSWIRGLDGLNVSSPAMVTVGGLLGSSAAWFASALLPGILGFAGGAMLYIISDEIIPETHRKGHEDVATGSLMMGVALMLVFGTLLEPA